MTDLSRVMCAEPSCPRYLTTDPRHYDNLTAAQWTCADHQKVTS